MTGKGTTPGVESKKSLSAGNKESR